jgi:hypothetical protein
MRAASAAHLILSNLVTITTMVKNIHYLISPFHLSHNFRFKYSQTRLQRHERDWIFCVVINECRCNRGVSYYG